MKVVGSWSKPDLGESFISRKKVDWSIFEYGSHVPLEFIGFFNRANNEEKISLGERHDIILIIDDKEYDAYISNINRRNVDSDTVQLRYDSNNELKTYLSNRLQQSYNYLVTERAKKKEANDKSKVLVPDSLAEYLDFYETGKPFCYRVEITKDLQQEEEDKKPLVNVWWVNQSTSLNKAKAEGCLWAPLKDKRGNPQYHWETMVEVKEGDIVLHYSEGFIKYISRAIDKAIEAPIPDSLRDNNWNEKGRLIYTDYNELNPQIPLNKISQEILKLYIKEGPINLVGGVKQGYLFRFTKEALLTIQKLTPDTNWPEFSKINVFDEVVQDMEGRDNDGNIINDFEVKDAIDRISKYIISQGFTYEEDLIKNFYISLKSKPFVILAGTSGTGKSKLVKLFAEAVGATSENGRYKLVPVKPDWSDTTDLLGYRDLKGDFHPGVLTSFIKKAIEDIENPYFMCLDEMNLARVEYYFSDILSVMETRVWKGNTIVTDKLLHEEIFGGYEEAKKNYQDIYIPENLYIIGTVNMDETTFPFSKKVLDRANTIEFSHVDFDYSFNKNPEVDPISLNNKYFKSKFLRLDDCEEYEEIVLKVVTILKSINETLLNSNLHFGYRIRDEICYYTIYNEENNLLSFNDSMDNEILQKILPRIQGSSSTIKRAIIGLFKICINNTDHNFNDEDSGVSGAMDSYIKDNPNISYKKSASKLAFMMRRFEEDGITSYWL